MRNLKGQSMKNRSRWLFGDNDYRQRRDIDQLQDQLDSIPDHLPYLLSLRGRADRLELVCQALMELLIARDVCTQEELDLLMLQIDLRDGVEDGRINPEVRESAPQCSQCQHFLSPRHQQCVYCGAQVTSNKRGKRPIKLVKCEGCSSEVPDNQTYFTANGIRCAECFKHYSEDF